MWVRRSAPELRIISKELALAVDTRRGDRESRYLRASNGPLIGRPSTVAKYLLSGLLVCPCGARFEALKGGNWTYKGAVYVCAARRRKGPSVCNNALVLPIEETDDTILTSIEGTVFHPDFIERLLDSAFVPLDVAAIQSERDRLRKEI